LSAADEVNGEDYGYEDNGEDYEEEGDGDYYEEEDNVYEVGTDF
jgi:hypothetical protein